MRRFFLFLALALLTGCKATKVVTDARQDVEQSEKVEELAISNHLTINDTIYTEITEHVTRKVEERFDPTTGNLVTRTTEEEENRREYQREIESLKHEVDSLAASLESYLRDKSTVEVKEKEVERFPWWFWFFAVPIVFAVLRILWILWK